MNTEKLNLVITLKDNMQSVMDVIPLKNTDLYRAGMELIRDLSQQILEFKKREPVDEATPPTTETVSVISSLLTRLTNHV